MIHVTCKEYFAMDNDYVILKLWQVSFMTICHNIFISYTPMNSTDVEAKIEEFKLEEKNKRMFY